MSQILDTQYDNLGNHILDSQESGALLPTISVSFTQANNTVSSSVDVVAPISVGASFTQDDNTLTVAMAVALPALSVPSFVTAARGSNAVITFTISPVTAMTSYANIALNSGVSSAGVDYPTAITNGMLSNGVTINSDSLTIPPGISSFTITIPIYS